MENNGLLLGLAWIYVSLRPYRGSYESSLSNGSTGSLKKRTKKKNKNINGISGYGRTTRLWW